MKMSSPSRPYPSALSAISTESVIAHMPIPSAWAHLIHRWRGPPSPRGEGSVAHQNFYVNITEVGRNRILTIGIRISRQCPPQARPMVAPTFRFSFHLVQISPREARRSATKYDEGGPVIAKKVSMTFLIERISSVQLGDF